MAHDDRRTVELADHIFEHVDDLRHLESLDRCRVCAERLDLDLEPWVRGRQHRVALGLVVALPVLPAARRDPEAVDQNDRVGSRI
jgi:hypothetical protein